MKILTIGAGVIGTTYSWQLQKAGYDLTHLVRRNTIDEYKEQGIKIRCLDLRKAGTLLARGKEYGIKMPVYEGYQEYVLDYSRKIVE